MKKYNCIGCKFYTHDKSQYGRHLKTKKHLQLKCTPNASQMHPKCTIMHPNCTPIAPIKKYVCKYCNKEFSYRQGVERHIKNSCKENKDESFKEMARLMNEVANMKKEMVEKDKEMQANILKKDKKYENLQKQLGRLNNKLQITNSNISNNINNTIVVLNSFDKPDTSMLNNKNIQFALKNIGACIPNLVKNVYFNPKNPSNHSICVSNLKKEFATIFNGEQWDTVTIEYLLHELSVWGETILEEWLVENGSDKLLERFEIYISNMECRTEMQKSTKDNLLLICYNGRKKLKIQPCVLTADSCNLKYLEI